MLGRAGVGTDNRSVTALTIGITTARDPACKRGLAVNLAASVARDAAGVSRVCLVDADPLTLDVTTRLAVRGPCLEDFAEAPGADLGAVAGALAEVHEPPLWVLPSAGGGVGLTHRALGRVLPRLRAGFDVVICDLVGGPSGPARVVSDRLDQLDWLLLAVTPEIEPVEAAARFVDQFEAARDCGHVAASVRLGVVITGDESSTALVRRCRRRGAGPARSRVGSSALGTRRAEPGLRRRARHRRARRRGRRALRAAHGPASRAGGARRGLFRPEFARFVVLGARIVAVSHLNCGPPLRRAVALAMMTPL